MIISVRLMCAQSANKSAPCGSVLTVMAPPPQCLLAGSSLSRLMAANKRAPATQLLAVMQVRRVLSDDSEASALYSVQLTQRCSSGRPEKQQRHPSLWALGFIKNSHRAFSVSRPVCRNQHLPVSVLCRAASVYLSLEAGIVLHVEELLLLLCRELLHEQEPHYLHCVLKCTACIVLIMCFKLKSIKAVWEGRVRSSGAQRSCGRTRQLSTKDTCHLERRWAATGSAAACLAVAQTRICSNMVIYVGRE